MKKPYPNGPRINLFLVIAAKLFPSRFPPVDILEFGVSIARKYGDLLYYRFGPLQVWQISHPDLARQVFVEEPEKYHKPKMVKWGIRPIARDGLITSDGALWKRQRKLMQPAFLHRRLAVYGDSMAALAAAMAESFKDGEVRDIGVEMSKLSMAIVVKSLFGSDLPCDPDYLGRNMIFLLDASASRLTSPFRIPSWLPTRRNRLERRAVAEIDSVLRSLTLAVRASQQERDDLLSVLVAATDDDSGQGMSDNQLRDEIMVLFLAGHETTANALTWTWYLLARHPEVEAKLQEELHRVLAGRLPAYADLPNLPYTEMIVREALRLYPPAPGVAREPIEEVALGGYRVGKGHLVSINIYALQHDERFFPDPARFDPERFAHGWEDRTPRHAYLPFGAGPRVCIGNGFAMMEARLVLATLAQRCRLTLESPDEIKPVQLVALRPATPVRMRMEKRGTRV